MSTPTDASVGVAVKIHHDGDTCRTTITGPAPGREVDLTGLPVDEQLRIAAELIRQTLTECHERTGLRAAG